MASALSQSEEEVKVPPDADLAERLGIAEGHVRSHVILGTGDDQKVTKPLHDATADGIESLPNVDTADTDNANGQTNFCDATEVVVIKEIGDATKPGIVEDPVVFVDPVGTRWSFPYEFCKTWDGMKKLMKQVFVDCYLSEWYQERIEDADPSHETFTMVKQKPEKSFIMVQHWEKLIQPGWEITILFYRDVNYLLKMAEENKEKTKAESEPEETSEATTEPEIAYVAQVWMKDGNSSADLLHEHIYDKPIGLEGRHQKSDQPPSVLREVKRFYRASSRSFRDLSIDDQIKSADTSSNPVLYINSEHLLNALRTVVEFQSERDEEIDQYQSSWRLEKTDLDQGIFVFPFRDLFHHLDELEKYKTNSHATRHRYRDESRSMHDEDYNSECDRHIDILIKYLRDQPTIRISEAEAMWRQKVPVTRFSSFWLLLKPGTDVYVWQKGQLNAYVIGSVSGGPRGTGRISRAVPYIVHLWNLQFDGKGLTRTQKTVIVQPFDGERDITGLPLFPTWFYDDKDETKSHRESLIERGKKYCKIARQPTFQEYRGQSSSGVPRVFNRARVIVDHTSQPWDHHGVRGGASPGEFDDDSVDSGTRVPWCQCATCEATKDDVHECGSLAFENYKNIHLNEDTKLTDHQYLLCWSHVYGFVLRERSWDLLTVDGLTEPYIEKDVIDNLVMNPESNKKMIKAICETYTKGKDQDTGFRADFIRGKGEGHICLLHGPPGTGKTLTAESVAEYTSRPLLSITAADLGHDPEELEENLLRFFQDADKWDAIVLLDEADVYLERRSTNDLRRNSIVSIFLRALDYFQGILFLTTNRVGSFDEAFMSRIHVQIAYAHLSEDARQQVWEYLMSKLETNHEHDHGKEFRCAESARSYVKENVTLQKLEWNGREIRNAIQTAVSLAMFDAKSKNLPVPTLKREHLAQVVEMSKSFKEYMESALGDTPSKIAHDQKIRDDDFPPKEK